MTRKSQKKARDTTHRIRMIAKENNMHIDTLRCMNYSQICRLRRVGKENAKMICTTLSIPMIPTKKEVVVVGAQFALFHRDKGKRTPYKVWDFPDMGMVPNDEVVGSEQFRFFHERLNVRHIDSADLGSEDTSLRLFSEGEIRDMAKMNTARPIVHDRVLRYLAQCEDNSHTCKTILERSNI
jgi:hypothetical protein